MNLRATLGKLLRWFRNRVYRGRVRTLVRKVGANQSLADAYWTAAYFLSPDIQRHSVCGETVKFQVATFSEFMRFRDLTGEKKIIGDLLSSLRDDDVCFDVGANVGTYSCFLASSLGPGRTFAFEPEPINADRLEQNLRLNDLEASVIRVALSDRAGNVELALQGSEAGAGSHTLSLANAEQTIDVSTERGDGVIRRLGLPGPTVMKIDVEGAELEVLKGFSDTLETTCRLLYVEVHPSVLARLGATTADVRVLLTGAGFSIQDLSRRQGQMFWRAEKRA